MEQLANNPITTLASSINNSVTSLTVTSGSAFPATGNFTVKIGTELLRVSLVSGTTWTVARGAEGTTAASHASSDTVTQVVSNNVVATLFSEMVQVGGYASRPSTVRAGTEYIASDCGNLSWKYNGTDWSLNKPLYVPYANRINISGWTALNATGLTWDDRNGANFPTVAGTTNDHIRGAYKSLPAAPYTVTLICGRLPFTQSHVAAGLVLYDSGSTKCKYIINDGYDNGNRYVIENWSNPDTFFSTIAGTEFWFTPSEWYYIRLVDDNTNWIYSFSYDGVNFTKFFTETRNSYLTPTNLGIGLYKQSDHFGTTTAPFQLFGYWEA